MTRHLRLVAASVAAGLALACDSPTDPGPLQRPSGGQGLFGNSLKLDIPAPFSPRDGQIADSTRPTLMIINARGYFVPGLPVRVVFEVFNDSGALVHCSAAIPQHPSDRTAYVLPVALASGRTYTWRVFAVLDNRQTPPSLPASFLTP